jgi:hypothetical protein
MVQTFLPCVVGGTLDLVAIVVKPNDFAAGKSGYLTGRATNSTPNVENLHTLV